MGICGRMNMYYGGQDECSVYVVPSSPGSSPPGIYIYIYIYIYTYEYMYRIYSETSLIIADMGLEHSVLLLEGFN